MTTGEIRQLLAKQFRGGSMRDEVYRLLVVYDALVDCQQWLEDGWVAKYDDSSVALYAERQDGLATRAIFADTAADIVSALLDEIDELEYREYTVREAQDDNG